MKVLLHPTDFTANSEEAFLIACGVARDQGARLIVLHVVSPRECADGDLCGNELTPESDLHYCVWSRLEHLKSLAGNLDVTLEVTIGETLESVLEVARREHCDLIVVASRCHVGSYYQVYGCISEALVRWAPCSVLTLRHFHSPDVAGQHKVLQPPVCIDSTRS